MPFDLFYSRHPAVAERETRVITVPPGSPSPLPPASYALCEMFCDEPGCDCRRVMFYILASPRQEAVAVVAYGWESHEFYAQWLHREDAETIANLQGPVLNLGSPQASYAPLLLELVEHILLTDPAYVARIKRHYAMFRAAVEQSLPPARQPRPAGKKPKGKR